MRSKLIVIALVLFVSMCFSYSPGYAGWVMKEANGDETLVAHGKMKSSWYAGGMIMNGNDGTLIMYDDQKKMYTEGPVADLCEFATSMFDQMMANIPPEQRDMVMQMMGGSDRSSPPKVTVKKKGDGGKIVGFSTEQYDVIVDGDLYEEIWIATDKTLTNDFRPLMGFIAEVTGCLGSIAMIGQTAPETTDEYATLFNTGVMLKIVNHQDESGAKGMDVTGLEQTDVPESTFKVPNGYRKVEFGEMFNVPME